MGVVPTAVFRASTWVFTYQKGESPRVCSGCGSWFCLLLIWDGAEVGFGRDRAALLTTDNAPLDLAT